MPAAAKKHKAKDKIIKSRRTMVGTLEGLRSQGKTIVLTNGCFDILHVGHVRSLEDARSRGDFLVVAVNEDETVTRLKGKGFPVNPVEERMEILAGLTSVDYVCSFSEETADALIKAFKPALYAKGTDYTERSVPEAATVKEIGAKVVIVGDKKKHSSSQVVEKIRKRKFD